MVHANLVPESFSLDNLLSKDVFRRDPSLVKKSLWDLLLDVQKAQNTAPLEGYISRILDSF